MPTAIREPHFPSNKLPKIHTAYQVTFASPLQSPLTAVSNKRSGMPLGTSRELPMPKVTRIASLGQAQATLQHCSTKLSKSWQKNPDKASPPASPIDAHERRHFQQWLEQWEHAFTAYLSQSMAGMKTEDIARCRVLKANHLSCTILASDAGSSGCSFDVYESEFQAIVELAGAVMQSRSQKGDGSSMSDSDASTSLDVREPLYLVVARCSRVTIRNHAIQLLGKLSSR